MKRTFAAALTLLAACSPAAAPPPAEPAAEPAPAAAPASAALNPVGVFEFATTVDGEPLTGTIEVTGSPGAYGGVIRTSATPDLPISGVITTGNEMVVTSTTPDGTLTLRMAFTGNDFTGGWDLGEDSGELTGRRRR